MGSIVYSNPQVTIGNDLVLIKANSLKFKMGKIKTTVRSVSGGGGETQTVHGQDASTAISEVSFEVAVTDDNRALVSKWQDNIGGNVFLASQTGLANLVGTNMSVTEDPEWQASSDGWALIKLAGDPLSDNV